MTRVKPFIVSTLMASGLSIVATFAQPVRIATFNLKWLTATATETRMAPWENEDHLAEHRRALAAIIATTNADVLAVQEVTSRVALEKLAAEPTLAAFKYRVLHIESEDNGTGQDVAFLVSPRVRLDTIGGAAIRRFADTLAGRPANLNRRDPRKQRLTKHALVCFSKPIKACVLGVHLLAHPDDMSRTRKRETQARIVAHLIRSEIVETGYTPIVLGDLNDFDPEAGGPSNPKDKKRHVTRIIRDYDTTRAGIEMVNVATRIQPTSARYSAWWDKNKNDIRDLSDPLSLIDHIMVDKQLAKQIVKAEIRHDLHDGTVSDHWPVVVDINVK